MRKRMRSVALYLAVMFGIVSAAGCGAKAEATGSSLGKNEASAGSVSTKAGDLEGKWVVSGYQYGDEVTPYDQLVQSGMATEIYLTLDSDGSGVLSMFGNDMEMTFQDGKVSTFGQDLYTYEMQDADTIQLSMMDALYTLVREGSEAASKIGEGDVVTADAGATEGDAESVKEASTGSGEFQLRRLMAGEEILELDGGTLYYETNSEGAAITYGYVNAKDFYIPEEIDGKKVYGVRRLHGYVENLYIPNGVSSILPSFGDFDGLRTLTIGYGDGESSFKNFAQGGCEYGHFDRGELKEITFPESVVDDDTIEISSTAFAGAEKLTTINHLPALWKEGTDSLEAAKAMLTNPSDYISPQSEKVTSLAREITEGCTTDRDKVYEICKWVCENVSYDMKGFEEFCAQRMAEYYGREYHGNPDPVEWIEPDEVIDHKVTVCSGYSKLTKALCNAVGIPAVYVMGPITTMDEVINLHAWNMVYIDGQWEHIDNTWSDTDYNSEPYIPDEFQDEYEEGKFRSEITYEMYLENEELQQAYSWEDLQQIQGERAERLSFDARHPYFCISSLLMGADHIAREVDGMTVQIQ